MYIYLTFFFHVFLLFYFCTNVFAKICKNALICENIFHDLYNLILMFFPSISGVCFLVSWIWAALWLTLTNRMQQYDVQVLNPGFERTSAFHLHCLHPRLAFLRLRNHTQQRKVTTNETSPDQSASAKPAAAWVTLVNCTHDSSFTCICFCLLSYLINSLYPFQLWNSYLFLIVHPSNKVKCNYFLTYFLFIKYVSNSCVFLWSSN